MKRLRRRKAAVMFTVGLAVCTPVIEACTMSKNDQYNVVTNGIQDIYLTLARAVTKQVAGPLYRDYCKGDAVCVATNLMNVNVPGDSGFSFLGHGFTIHNKDLWQYALTRGHTFNGDLNAQLYGVLYQYVTGTGKPCFRYAYALDVPFNQDPITDAYPTSVGPSDTCYDGREFTT